MRSGRFPLVDSLRAVAALAILVFHVAQFAGAHEVPVLSELVLRLQAGVALFFLISGFLLYRPFVAARVERRDGPRVGVYAWHRVLRIVPAYWAVLTVAGLLITPGILGRPVLFYGFVQVYDSQLALAGLPVAWSLCVEVAFYVMLPFYALAMAALPVRGARGVFATELAGVVLLAVAGIGFRAWALGGGGKVLGAPLLTLPAFLDWFALGIGLAVLSVWLQRAGGLPGPLRSIDRRPGLAWAVAAGGFGLTVVAGGLLADRSTAEDLTVHVLFGLVSLAVLAPAVIGDPERGRVRHVLANPVLLWLGLVSYGIFLWQLPAIDLIGISTPLDPITIADPNPWVIAIAPPATIAFAAISYYVLERPALSLKRKFGA